MKGTKLQLLCDECGKTIMVSDDLNKLIAAIPDHKLICKPKVDE